MVPVAQPVTFGCPHFKVWSAKFCSQNTTGSTITKLPPHVTHSLCGRHACMQTNTTFDKSCTEVEGNVSAHISDPKSRCLRARVNHSIGSSNIEASNSLAGDCSSKNHKNSDPTHLEFKSVSQVVHCLDIEQKASWGAQVASDWSISSCQD